MQKSKDNCWDYLFQKCTPGQNSNTDGIETETKGQKSQLGRLKTKLKLGGVFSVLKCIRDTHRFNSNAWFKKTLLFKIFSIYWSVINCGDLENWNFAG